MIIIGMKLCRDYKLASREQFHAPTLSIRAESIFYQSLQLQLHWSSSALQCSPKVDHQDLEHSKALECCPIKTIVCRISVISYQS